MTGTVTIGKTDILMTANAATEIRYQMIFNSDILTVFFKLYKDMGETLNFTNADMDLINEAVGIASRLAFVMAKAAEKADMTRLSIDDYIEWLEQFETMDLLGSSGKIFKFWLGQRATKVTSKNPKAPNTTGK